MINKTTEATPENYTINFIHPAEANHLIYMKLPKFLLKDSRFQNLSINAIVLYTAMLDKSQYAADHNQVDAEGRVYIDYSLEETCYLLKCSLTTAKKVRKELRECFGKNNGLVKFVSRGQGRNDYVYVLSYHEDTSAELPKSESPIQESLSKPELNSIRETSFEPSRETHFEPSRETHFNPSRETEFATYYKTNKENNNKNNIYHLSFTNQSLRKTDDKQHFPFSPVSAVKGSSPDLYATASEDFKTQIGYEQLLCYAPDKTTLIDDMIEVMAQEYVSSSAETIINGRHYSRTAIMDCLKSIDLPTTKYILDCLGRNNTKVLNIHRYILATLLNAPASFMAQKAYEDQVKQNTFLSHDTGPSYFKPTIKRSYEPYHGRSYTDEEIHAFELKKLGITG